MVVSIVYSSDSRVTDNRDFSINCVSKVSFYLKKTFHVRTNDMNLYLNSSAVGCCCKNSVSFSFGNPASLYIIVKAKFPVASLITT